MLSFLLILIGNSAGADPTPEFVLDAIRDAKVIRVEDPLIRFTNERISEVVDEELLDLLPRALSFDGEPYLYTGRYDGHDYLKFDVVINPRRFLRFFVYDRNLIRFGAPSSKSKTGKATYEVKLKPTKEL